jgi:hypothetical protein
MEKLRVPVLDVFEVDYLCDWTLPAMADTTTWRTTKWFEFSTIRQCLIDSSGGLRALEDLARVVYKVPGWPCLDIPVSVLFSNET